MGAVNILEFIKIIRKYFRKILIFVCLIGIATYFVASGMQSYTCTLDLKFKNSGAEEGLAPNGDKLNVFDIMSPVVVADALDHLDIDNNLTVEKVRSNMSISEVITAQDTDIKESAAAKGEKYEVIPDEYIIKYEYGAGLGEEFGGMMFDRIVSAYDNWYVSQYYNKEKISDFLGVIDYKNMEYMDLCEVIQNNLDIITDYLDSMAGGDEEFRSLKTGYSFSELSQMYQNLKDIDYGKYYANVRVGLLSRDKEMLIKSYENKIRQLATERDVNYEKSQMYKREVTSFYDAYKASSLYAQAAGTQAKIGATNEKDEMIYDFNLEKVINTYDDIVLNYTNTGTTSTNMGRQTDFYQQVIDEYKNDSVPPETKEELLKVNESILQELAEKVKDYAVVANQTLEDYYDKIVTNDIEYVASASVESNLPVSLILIIALIVSLAAGCIFAIIYEFLGPKANRHGKEENAKPSSDIEPSEHGPLPEPESLEEKLLCQQANNHFNEFYLVYQPIVERDGSCRRSEVYVRWNSKELGEVSGMKFFAMAEKLKLERQLNAWLINKVVDQIHEFDKAGFADHIMNINCEANELKDSDFEEVLKDILEVNKAAAKRICVEVMGSDSSSIAYSSAVLRDLGAQVCVDRYDAVNNIKIIKALKPDCIKLDILASMEREGGDESNLTLAIKFRDIINQCRESGVKTIITRVETEMQKNLSDLIGADCQEGYLYAKPKPVTEHIQDLKECNNAKG